MGNFNFFVNSSYLSLNIITCQDGKFVAESFDSDKGKSALFLRTKLLQKEHGLFFFRSLVCLVLCQGHSIHSFAVIQLSCSQEMSEKMWNAVVKVSLMFPYRTEK